MHLGVQERDRRLAGEQLGDLEVRRVEMRLRAPHAPDIEGAHDIALTHKRHDDEGLVLSWCARNEGHPRIALGVVDALRFRVRDDPARDAMVEGKRVLAVSYTHLRAHETRHDL